MAEDKAQCIVSTPVGSFLIEEDGIGICRAEFLPKEEKCTAPSTALLQEAVRQLQEYFAGTRREFTLPLSVQGTEFQLDDWAALQEIPYGATCSYQDIAEAIGRPKAVRAVGMANHDNPVSIFIPCHRVIGKSGKLTGYGGGLDRKQFLLDLEGRFR